MRNFLVILASLICVTAVYAEEDDPKQIELDQECEAARQVALAPKKQQVYAECLEKGKEESQCAAERDEYNGARANRGPAFYDLPECEAAFNHRKGRDG